MQVILKMMLAFVWLVLIPLLIGTFFERREEQGIIWGYLVKGYLFLFFSAEVMILPLIFLNCPFQVLVWCYGGLLVMMCGLGIWQKRYKKLFVWKKKRITQEDFFGIAAVLVILVQIFMVVFYTHLDADDAMYVGAATTAMESNTIFSVSPYTGCEYTKIESRYVLSPFPVFLAVVSQLSGGLHPAIMAHMLLPAVLFVLAYSVIYLLSKKWFKDNTEAQGIFVLCVAILNWFSAYSVYNAGMFQMVRIWQGKAVLAAVLIPLLYYLAEPMLTVEKMNGMNWVLLLFTNVSCCLVSSMGIILSPLVLGIMDVIGFVKHRNIKQFVVNGLCCVPSLILGVVYIWIR